MTLNQGTTLQGGKYIIKKVLGQGGFGITYLAEHTLLGADVAIKEFFMREQNNRDEATSQVSVGSVGSRELVAKFKAKFLKEARNIFRLNHPNIIRILDIFEENDTAYYVMEYCEGGSLLDLIKLHPNGLPEEQALTYIKQVASAVAYIHKKKMNHLDIKPGNIVLNKGEAVLIDFGMSKQYDAETGEQTSTTPVGISEGYAPMEQYKKGGVGEFSPTTDVYALGATLFKLITGQTPPDASVVNEDGLPHFNALPFVHKAIVAAMHSRRADRPQSIEAWLDIINGASVEFGEETIPLFDPYKEERESLDWEAAANAEKEKAVAEARAMSEKKRKEREEAECMRKGVEENIKKQKRVKNINLIWAAVVGLAIVLGIFSLGNTMPKQNIAPIDSVNEEVVTPLDTVDIDSEIVMQLSDSIETLFAVESTKPTVGYLSVKSTPQGALLYVDGKNIGKTPIVDYELTPGKHALNLKKDASYEEMSATINIMAGRSKKVEYQLKLIPVEINNIGSSSGTIFGHEWVDLGLSVKWATCNVGAPSPSDYGNYYAWGETRTKSRYDWDNCFDYIGNNTWGIYKEGGKTKITPESGNDAARENWGGSWRLPSRSECIELEDKCKWIWSSYNGHNGFMVTGPNGNSIFLPFAGVRSGIDIEKVEQDGFYWSSDLSPYTNGACGLIIEAPSRPYHENGYIDGYNQGVRISGRSIRPVMD